MTLNPISHPLFLPTVPRRDFNQILDGNRNPFRAAGVGNIKRFEKIKNKQHRIPSLLPMKVIVGIKPSEVHMKLVCETFVFSDNAGVVKFDALLPATERGVRGHGSSGT